MMEKTIKGVVISHPGHLLVAYQAALGLQEAGLLDGFETGYYYKDSRFSRILLSMLPQQVAARLLRQLRRRTHEGLASQRVRRTHPVAEIIFVLFARLPALSGLAEKIMHLRNEYFDAAVGRVVHKSRPRAVVCYDSSALKTFEAASEVGTLCILDQVVGHIKTGERILSEECQLHPEFADTLPGPAAAWALKRCTIEAIDADLVLAASEYVRDSLIMNGVSPSRIALCPYGVDTERFRPAVKIDEHPFQILFVGQLSQRKGIKYLLEAFKELRLEKAELVLMGGVGGSGDGLKSYEGLFRHIRHVPYSELPQYYQSADIFVYPSLHEGSALAIYEALASGLPVITTPNSGSVVRDGVDGFIVPIRDVEALKEKMLLLYQNKELRDRMSQQARKRAESFTWQAYRQRLGSIVQNFIQENKP
ncbi:MAG: glycosyltransferase family 4 protein [Ignavibacteriaceae bacterium]